MKHHMFLFLLFSITSQLSAQINIERLSTEIKNLKSKEAIKNYWGNLYVLDQEILLQTKLVKAYDSISSENMIRTALMIEIHGTDSYPKNIPIAVLNLAHSNITEDHIAFWPIISKCASLGGIIDYFGGKFPAYQLEGIGLTFYNYSLTNQEAIYQKLYSKIDANPKYIVSAEINRLFEKRKLLQAKVVSSIGKWRKQAFKDKIEDGFFEFVMLADKSFLMIRDNRSQPLLQVKNLGSIEYRIKNEPFGWTYKLDSDGNLSLLNEDKETLIKYSKI